MNAKSILIPTDFSKHAEAALDCATELAKSLGATLSIVHVESPSALAASNDDADNPTAVRARHPLGQVKPGDVRVNFNRALLQGDIADALLQFASDHRVEMIVMGARGQTNSSDAVLGSIAESVARRSTCLVVTVKPAAITTKTTTT